MASVLTPYKSSDGNNPYTKAQLEELWKDLEPKAREPGKYSPEERILLQREFLSYIQNGFSATRAVSRLQARALENPGSIPYADYATFMAWKEYDKNFAEAYDVAYAMGTDQLEDKAVEMAYSGNAAILQFLLKMRNPQRYAPKQVEAHGPGGTVEHVHRIELVAAPAKALEIEDGREDIIDAEVIDR